MIWQRLKKMKCPKCATDLVEKKAVIHCSDKIKCKFFINKNKFNSVVSSMYAPRTRQRSAVLEEQDSFSRLQKMDDHCNNEEYND